MLFSCLLLVLLFSDALSSSDDELVSFIDLRLLFVAFSRFSCCVVVDVDIVSWAFDREEFEEFVEEDDETESDAEDGIGGQNGSVVVVAAVVKL